MQQWYEDDCPKCQKTNWFNNGDPIDMTVGDVDGVKCWNCGHCWVLGDINDECEQSEDQYEEGKDFREVKHRKKRK